MLDSYAVLSGGRETPGAVPARQSERNEAFTRAVRAGDTKTAAALVAVEPPEDATEAERERWCIRRRLYRRAGLLPGAKAGTA